MRSYELIFIVHPDIDGDALTDVVNDVESLIGRHGGNVTRIEPWGLHKLAYLIHNQREGRYILSEFDLEPRSVADVEHGLKLMEPVMRHLIVRLDD